MAPDQFATVTTTNAGPHGVVNVTVNIPRVLLLDLMVKVVEPPAVISALGGEIVRLPIAEAVIVPDMLPSAMVTSSEPPFL